MFVNPQFLDSLCLSVRQFVAVCKTMGIDHLMQKMVLTLEKFSHASKYELNDNHMYIAYILTFSKPLFLQPFSKYYMYHLNYNV